MPLFVLMRALLAWVALCVAANGFCASANPCANKACGEACNTPCPKGMVCAAVMSYCQADGACGTNAAPACTSEPASSADPAPPASPAVGELNADVARIEALIRMHREALAASAGEAATTPPPPQQQAQEGGAASAGTRGMSLCRVCGPA